MRRRDNETQMEQIWVASTSLENTEHSVDKCTQKTENWTSCTKTNQSYNSNNTFCHINSIFGHFNFTFCHFRHRFYHFKNIFWYFDCTFCHFNGICRLLTEPFVYISTLMISFGINKVSLPLFLTTCSPQSVYFCCSTNFTACWQVNFVNLRTPFTPAAQPQTFRSGCELWLGLVRTCSRELGSALKSLHILTGTYSISNV